MKRNKSTKREFTAADIRTVFDASDYSLSTVKKVAYGLRHNKNLIKALRHAKAQREKLIHQLANKY